jgi:group II intron reverse transcriptase/maturase
MNMRNKKVRTLQVKLFHAAKQSLDRKFGALYDKIYRKDVLLEAWRRVKANRGAPGIDRQDFEYIEDKIGLEKFLTKIHNELKDKRYRPKPVLRRWIEKPGKTEKRPLGIPIVRDRVVQMAAKLVLEPIFETNFLKCSYGFRPKRSAHDAVAAIARTITFKRQTVVIDADIKGYFGNIRHNILLNLLRKRISDPRVIELIKGWLKAGVREEGKYIEAGGSGTPQGGVISPLLSNIYLHSFDKMIQQSGIPGTLVRYADDFVILLRRSGKQILEKVKTMLGRLGLELHRDKTRIVPARNGFDFLGMHFRLRPTSRKDAKLKQFCAVWPSDRSIKQIKNKIRYTIGRRYDKSLEDMIGILNPIIRGWNNYHRKARPVMKRLQKLNAFVRERFRIFLRRKYSDRSRGTRRVHDSLLVRLGLYQFG